MEDKKWKKKTILWIGLLYKLTKKEEKMKNEMIKNKNIKENGWNRETRLKDIPEEWIVRRSNEDKEKYNGITTKKGR